MSKDTTLRHTDYRTQRDQVDRGLSMLRHPSSHTFGNAIDIMIVPKIPVRVARAQARKARLAGLVIGALIGSLSEDYMPLWLVVGLILAVPLLTHAIKRLRGKIRT